MFNRQESTIAEYSLRHLISSFRLCWNGCLHGKLASRLLMLMSCMHLASSYTPPIHVRMRMGMGSALCQHFLTLQLLLPSFTLPLKNDTHPGVVLKDKSTTNRLHGLYLPVPKLSKRPLRRTHRMLTLVGGEARPQCTLQQQLPRELWTCCLSCLWQSRRVSIPSCPSNTPLSTTHSLPSESSRCYRACPQKASCSVL